MKCAYCKNTDKRTLWDEGYTIHCLLCHHRTRKNDGEDDSIKCPYCHRMRDKKAIHCRYCNDATWKHSTSKEFKEIDKILKDLGY